MYIDFEYAGHRLSDFGCILCSIDSNSGKYDVEIGCDITFTEVKNNISSIRSVASSRYENVYTATFDIIKYNCNDHDDVYMSSLEARNITKWLNRREYHKFMLVNDLSDDSNVHYYGSFNVKQIMFGYNILGLSLTFTSNAPYGFGDMIENKMMLLNPGEISRLHGDSDEYGIIYPKTIIRCFSNGDLKITNHTTGTSLEVKKCKNKEIVTIDGEHRIIYSSDTHTTLPNDFNYEYLDILVDETDSENEYSSTLPCELTVEYLPVRKVGVI